ncbi:hypothetical protein NPIL_667981 [Nephila pilipes]|uniref:Uncharacterized protein n=1 Tax=Nephila pilipes TaxID=299642 RepID=A0A8X6TE14_NEPPI|nr:hypothetical protein NPIL_667981 [Nephila pilipes]
MENRLEKELSTFKNKKKININTNGRLSLTPDLRSPSQKERHMPNENYESIRSTDGGEKRDRSKGKSFESFVEI